MKLKQYFESNNGLGVLSTADQEGKVNSAVYSRPQVIEDNKIAFIAADRLTHANLMQNPHAVYLFKEDGPGYKGKRLFLKKTGESQDQGLIDSLRRSCHGQSCEEGRDKKFLVYFDVEKELPLVVMKD
ncbi:MAG: pyridoxamine 5'-phosphate oxidase family protein [Candidatus Omnitrophica bacterium]|nr:pyridoxamine 5'-phosphate oxidase family protein [Candidatus Omnitrophota bacterium]